MRRISGDGTIQPFADNAELLDATFAVEATTGGFDLILESWGGPSPGGRPPRNPDYNPALEVLLARLGKIQAEVQLCVVDSSTMRLRPLSDRQLVLPEHPYPIALAEIVDVHGLRLEIGRAQRTVGRRPSSNLNGGNNTKRIRLSFSLPRSWQTPALEAFLAASNGDAATSNAIWTEVPTDDPEVFEARVRNARSKASAATGDNLPPAPPGSPSGQQVEGTTTRLVRDPNVLAWVLEAADGMCEVCTGHAPFRRSNGDHFLEGHHIRPLAEGGPDTVDNAVAACPNCHRELHHGVERELLRAKVIAKIARLVDYPIKPLPMSEPKTSQAAFVIAARDASSRNQQLILNVSPIENSVT